MTSAFSWQNSINVCPASFYTPRPNLPVVPSISWLSTFAFQSPIMKRMSFWVLFLERLVGLHRTVQLQLLPHYWSGHRLGLLWYWMVCLGNEQILLSFLRLQPSTASSTSYKYAQSNIKLVTLAGDDVQNPHLFFKLLFRPHPLLLCSLLTLLQPSKPAWCVSESLCLLCWTPFP